MDDYVAKPVKAADLYAAIDRQLTGMPTPDQVSGQRSVDHTSA
jgi:DNA-binding response OmpR family regulator